MGDRNPSVERQPPPYAEQWELEDDADVLGNHGYDEDHDLPVYAPEPTDLRSSFVGTEETQYAHLDKKLPIPELQDDAMESTDESESPPLSPSHSEIGDTVPTHRASKRSWLRNHLKKKKKPCPESTAIPISLSPPKISNRVLLSKTTIPLSDPAGQESGDPCPLQIVLETTLHEDHPYTIRSDLFRDQDLQSALTNFEVFDVETGQVISERPAASQQSTHEVASSTCKARRARRKRPVPRPLSRDACSELQPDAPLTKTIVAGPRDYRSSSKVLFDGLCIADPASLVGRRLGLRLRPATALWMAKSMADLFGSDDSLPGGWPDMYATPLKIKCDVDASTNANTDSDSASDSEPGPHPVNPGHEADGWAEFEVTETWQSWADDTVAEIDEELEGSEM
jgi:hypothetical protein